MNKLEYLSKLEACLKHRLSKAEINDIMRDYAEYFEEGRRQSKSDFEISAKLGDPELVAQQIIEESGENAAFSPINMKEEFKRSKDDARKWQVGSSAKGCLSSLLKITCLIILFPIALVAVCSGAFALIGILFALCCVLLLPLCGILLGIAGLFVSAFAISVPFFPIGLLGIFGSVALISLSVCFTALTIILIHSLCRWVGKLFVSLKRSLFPASSQKANREEAAPPQGETVAQTEPFAQDLSQDTQETVTQPQNPQLEEGNDHE